MTPRGECTAVFCAGAPVALVAIPKVNLDGTLDTVPTAPTSEEKAAGEEHAAAEAERVKLMRAQGRLRVRVGALDLPQGLDGKAAEEYADKKAVQLLPYALAELEYQLKFGTDKERAEAAKEVREMNGRGKRDLGGNSGPTIILVGSGEGNPFLKRVDVDGKNVK